MCGSPYAYTYLRGIRLLKIAVSSNADRIHGGLFEERGIACECVVLAETNDHADWALRMRGTLRGRAEKDRSAAYCNAPSMRGACFPCVCALPISSAHMRKLCAEKENHRGIINPHDHYN